MPIEKIHILLNEAEKNLNLSQVILNDLLQNSDEETIPSLEDSICQIQLTLQYRLSCQDTLGLLLNIDHNLLYLLGIQPQHSAAMNIDRLEYMLGNDDLKQVLHILSLLVSSLSRVAHHYQIQHAAFELKNKKNRLTAGLHKLEQHQEHLTNLLKQMHTKLQQIPANQVAGPLLDHIAALRGPISQFHQAILHGLGLAKVLYHKINSKHVMEENLHLLLQKAEEILSTLPPPHLAPHYSPHYFKPLTNEQLEQRATAKRLRPFFN